MTRNEEGRVVLNFIVSLFDDLFTLVVAGTKWRIFFIVILSLVLIWAVLMLIR